MEFLEISPTLHIPLTEILLSAVRAQGAGGQHVNKVATGIHLRFDIPASSLPEEIKERLLQSADRRLTKDGVIVLKAQKSRSQEQNRQQALQQLQQLVCQALETPKPRKATRPTKSSREKRVTTKTRRGTIKSLRQKITE